MSVWKLSEGLKTTENILIFQCLCIISDINWKMSHYLFTFLSVFSISFYYFIDEQP